MKQRKIPVDYKRVYIAENGRQFSNERDCLIYEKYCHLSIYDVIKDYYIIEEKDIEHLKNNEIPHFSYLILIKKVPEEIERYCDLVENCKPGTNENNEYSFETSSLPPSNIDSLYYNNWDFDGNGWEEIGTKEDIQEKIKEYTDMLFKFKD